MLYCKEQSSGKELRLDGCSVEVRKKIGRSVSFLLICLVKSLDEIIPMPAIGQKYFYPSANLTHKLAADKCSG